MPSDLDQLAQENEHQDRWRVPRSRDDLQSLAGQQAMTHQPSTQQRLDTAEPTFRAPIQQFARQTLINPLRTTGFLPQQQTPEWFDKARQIGGQLFREGPMPMLANQFPRGGISDVLARNNLIPQALNDNPVTRALRSRELMQATQFFTPLIGTLKLAPSLSSGIGRWRGTHYDVIHDETGQKRADVWLDYNPETKNLTLDYGTTVRNRYISGRTDPRDARRWALGSNPDNPIEAMVELRSALPEVFRLYPDMKTVDLTSIGGARGAHSRTAQLKYEVQRTPEGIQWKRIKDNPVTPRENVPLRPHSQATSNTSWGRYWNSIGTVSQEETDRLYNEYIQSLTPWSGARR